MQGAEKIGRGGSGLGRSQARARGYMCNCNTSEVTRVTACSGTRVAKSHVDGTDLVVSEA